MVSVYSPSVQFGLIQLGHSLSESLTITNESKCMANYVLKQIVSNNETDTVVQVCGDIYCTCDSEGYTYNTNSYKISFMHVHVTW